MISWDRVACRHLEPQSGVGLKEKIFDYLSYLISKKILKLKLNSNLYYSNHNSSLLHIALFRSKSGRIFIG